MNAIWLVCFRILHLKYVVSYREAIDFTMISNFRLWMLLFYHLKVITWTCRVFQFGCFGQLPIWILSPISDAFFSAYICIRWIDRPGLFSLSVSTYISGVFIPWKTSAKVAYVPFLTFCPLKTSNPLAYRHFTLCSSKRRTSFLLKQKDFQEISLNSKELKARTYENVILNSRMAPLRRHTVSTPK